MSDVHMKKSEKKGFNKEKRLRAVANNPCVVFLLFFRCKCTSTKHMCSVRITKYLITRIVRDRRDQ